MSERIALILIVMFGIGVAAFSFMLIGDAGGGVHASGSAVVDIPMQSVFETVTSVPLATAAPEIVFVTVEPEIVFVTVESEIVFVTVEPEIVVITAVPDVVTPSPTPLLVDVTRVRFSTPVATRMSPPIPVAGGGDDLGNDDYAIEFLMACVDGRDAGRRVSPKCPTATEINELLGGR